ncbi:MAG: UvrD-helicase domain-containing protein [Syntrophorhabdaceae bacterium]|nr:UvrD-helicase domain-containing protein [Syntrophorhabdaceae bacterium]
MLEQREKAAREFTRNLAVDASAGTGKTATLVARVTNLFLEQPKLLPDEVLLLTFTDKAAAEMKARVTEGWERLFAAAQDQDETGKIEEELRRWNPMVRIPSSVYEEPRALRRRADEMVDAVGRLSVTTFHSFCARILRSFPAEAGVDPLFEVLPGNEEANAWNAAFRLFLRGEFGSPAVSPMWEKIFMREHDAGKVWDVIRRLCLTQRDLLRGDPPDFGNSADFRKFLLDEYLLCVEYFRAFVAGIVAPDDDDDPTVMTFRAALPLLEEVWSAINSGDLTVAAAKAVAADAAFDIDLNKSRSKKKFPRPDGPSLSKVRDSLRKLFSLVIEIPEGDAAARFLFSRAGAALAAYERMKGSGLDFMDLLLRADAVLSSNPEVARRLSNRFRYIFVDEFQDTDPLQARMLRILSAGGPPGKLFVVGDPKQSIYGFRRADIQVYGKFLKEVAKEGGEDVSLSRNFRSRPDLLAALNGLFGRILSRQEDFSPPYMPVDPYRSDPGEGHPVTLYELAPEVDEANFLPALVRRIAGTVKIRGEDGKERPAMLRDIAVLYRSDASGEVLSGYRNALTGAGIPNIVPSRRGFFSRQEVQDLRIVLSAVDVPGDLSARYAALKTIFFGLSDEEILPLYGDNPDSVSGRVKDALGLLSRLSAGRERVLLPDLLARLYRETGVDFVAARLPEGERIIQNLSKAAEMARAFEWKGAGSLKLFLADIRKKMEEKREENEVPDFEEDEDAVRLSTIHAAKGLEFPVVILGALSRGGKKEPRGMRVDRVHGISALIFHGFRTYSAFRQLSHAGRPLTFERWEREKMAAEERRLLYVAATRAKDRLYLLKGGRGKGSDLLDALMEGIEAGEPAGDGACSLMGLSGHRVRFGSTVSDGSLGGELLRVEVNESLHEEPYRYEVSSLPSVSVNEPEMAEAEELLPLEVAPVTLARLYNEERGRRFGDKIHRLLDVFPPVVSLWPPKDAVLPVEWTEKEEERWKGIVEAVCSSELFRRLCSSRLVGTEVSMLGFRDGCVKEDRADLVVRVPGDAGGMDEYWVIDYKTGSKEPDLEERYLTQVREYRSVLAEAWDVPVRGFIWYVESGEAVEVV